MVASASPAVTLTLTTDEARALLPILADDLDIAEVDGAGTDVRSALLAALVQIRRQLGLAGTR